MMHSAEQRSKEWYKNRLGKVTASRMSDVLAAPSSERRKSYMMQLIAERLSGVSAEDVYVSKEMQRGIDLEDMARAVFAMEKGLEVREAGFFTDADIEWLGASPDGLTSDGGLVEIKCPKTATHIGYCVERKCPAKYYAQIQCQLAVTGLSHAYFVSYDDRVPGQYQMFCVHVPRDETYIKEMREKVLQFLDEAQDIINTLGEGF